MNTQRLVLISGGAGGIGSALCTSFCQLGYAVGIGYSINRHKAEALAEQLTAQGGQALAVAMDYESRASIRDAMERVTEHFRLPVSILINNGALAQEKPFDTITDQDWERMLSINLQGPFIAVQEALQGMRQQQWGRVINITSIGGQWGGFNQVHYAASKAALINFTQSIAKIYSREGIASMAVAIGLVATEMSARELATEAGKEKVKNIPAGRLAYANEVAKQVLHLCQEESFYLTGQTINMNGGMYFG
ncbi:SDR family NAD(P)-dependent oxidoreductase [Shewanella sp. GD04112]|uniref:SDR family NAD(P)-dependent oxidoreductase n=1 Tax=Shewanella sp. GD04112 TaxID=2975434 RepID=UPI002448FA5A|nr:SDR family NAD(P)-dependent oxidoreductase [Shewanella sp. GD04112]MDH0447858.1 SDR family NAD(P)-dependent oxidoreductase [Shewanella sp. GD04112]